MTIQVSGTVFKGSVFHCLIFHQDNSCHHKTEIPTAVKTGKAIHSWNTEINFAAFVQKKIFSTWILNSWTELWGLYSCSYVCNFSSLFKDSKSCNNLRGFFQCLHGNMLGGGAGGESNCWRVCLAAELHFWAGWMNVKQAWARWTSANQLDMNTCGFIFFFSFSNKLFNLRLIWLSNWLITSQITAISA